MDSPLKEQQFRNLLRPVVPSVPRLALPDDSHIGLSTFARLTIYGNKDWRVVAFQGEAGCTRMALFTHRRIDRS